MTYSTKGSKRVMKSDPSHGTLTGHAAPNRSCYCQILIILRRHFPLAYRIVVLHVAQDLRETPIAPLLVWVLPLRSAEKRMVLLVCELLSRAFR